MTLYRYGDQYVSTLELDPATGTVPTQRLQPGVYNVTSWLPVDANASGVALVGDPHVVVGGADSTVTLDAREANEISVRTPRPSIDGARRPGYFHDSGIGGPFASFANQYAVSPAIDHVYAAPTGQVDGGRYEFVMRWRRTAPLLSTEVGRHRARRVQHARGPTLGRQARVCRRGRRHRHPGGLRRLATSAARRSWSGASDDVMTYEVAATATAAGATLAGRGQRPARPVRRLRRRHRPARPRAHAARGATAPRQARPADARHARPGRHRAGGLRLRPGPLLRRRDPDRPDVGAAAKGDLATITNRFVGEARPAGDREPRRLPRLELAAVPGVRRAGPPRHRARRLRQHAGRVGVVRGRAGHPRMGAPRRPAVPTSGASSARTAGSSRWLGRAPVPASGSRAGAATSSPSTCRSPARATPASPARCTTSRPW